MIVIPYTTASRSIVAPTVGSGFDRLFDETLSRVFARPAVPAVRTPAMDVSETDTAYTVVFDVPGAVKEQLQVTVEGRKLSVATTAAAAVEAPATTADVPAGEAADKPSARTPAARALYRERPAARFARTVVLPTEVDQASSQARFDNGVLTLTLAKRVPSGATQISIR